MSYGQLIQMRSGVVGGGKITDAPPSQISSASMRAL